ncbi:MAG: tetratricopeptide repeat protein, partial [Candidatus Binatia bacterium]
NHLITYYGGHNLPDVRRILKYYMKTEYYMDTQQVLELANNLYYLRNYDLARKFYEHAEEISIGDFSPTDLAVFCNILVRARDYERALPICIDHEQSSGPCKGNTIATRLTIARIYKEKRNWRKVAEYSEKIIQCQPNHKIARSYLMMATERAN